MRALSIGPGPAVVAIDVGGTTIKASSVDAHGILSEPVRVATPAAGSAIVDDVVSAVARIADELAPAGTPIGLAVPGIVDESRGLAVFSENLGWRDVPLREIAEERTGRPVHLLHDVRASGRAECQLGAGAGLADVVVVTIGTGISAAVQVHGLPVVRGGFAGEIGHAVVVPGGEPCACGNRGCLEAIASAGAIGRIYARLTGSAPSGAEEVLRRADAGDPVARRVWGSAVDALGAALASVSALLAPEAIVIAGGLSEAGERLLVPLRERIAAGFSLRQTEVRLARLGQDAGLVGAALGAREGEAPR